MIDIDAIRNELPPTLLAQLTDGTGKHQFDRGELIEAVTRLLALHGELSINELLVGVYQYTGKVITRTNLHGGLAYMSRSGQVHAIARGIWSRTPQKESRTKKRDTIVGPHTPPARFRDPFPPPAIRAGNSIG